MNKQISEKIEYERNKIREESIKLRKEAKENHTCPNCGNPVSGNRLYCSQECAYAFFVKYDYSKNSEILRNYKTQLLQDENEKKPKKEIVPWSSPVARKEHKCWFCGLEIPKGEKYVKYTCLPGEEWFDESPYAVTSYHDQCMNFINECVEVGIFSVEGVEEDEVLGVLYALAIESNHSFEETRQLVRNGKFPDKDALQHLLNPDDYESDFSINPKYDDEPSDPDSIYIYLVAVRVQNTIHKELLEFWHEIPDSYEYFGKYYKEERMGDMFNGIISVKSLNVPVVQFEVEK